MAKWIDYSVDERNALIAKVAKAKNIDDAASEKDWWVTAVLYAVFHTSIAEYSLFKGGTSLSKGWDIISRFSEDIDIALDRSFYRDVKGYACAECATMTQIRNLRKKNQDFIFGEFKNELCEKLKVLGLPVIKVLDENEVAAEEGKDRNLYLEIVKHREKFYHPSHIDYSKELPEVIDFLPPATVVEDFRDD